MSSYRIGIDIGGTFTDIALVDAAGVVEILKVASTPDDYSRGIAEGLAALFAERGIDPGAVTGIVHATTVATNTILEQKGALTGLLTTQGFRDVLELRRLRIPVLYDLQYDKPPPLVPRRLRLEAGGRIGPDGGERAPLNEGDVRAAAETFRREGVQAVAVSFLHAYANPSHEIRAESLLREELGEAVYICRGSEILPEIREYERTSTAVVNAYVGPVIRGYAQALSARLESIGIRAPIEMMHSGGGIMRLSTAVRRAAALVESGPAAGVIACARLSRDAGDRANIISFDMGGTTAKVALVENGQPARTDEYEVGSGINLSSRLVKGGGYPIKMPFIDVSEIGAGGGSLIALDPLGTVSVGPESAGAMPGPVCYGRGGTQATLTDALVVLGYVNPHSIAGGSMAIDAQAARDALARQVAAPLGQSVEATARGVLRLAISTMTRAVKAVTTYRGRDPRDFTLVAFGGNGPVVACDIAATLGIRRIVVPDAAGVFSGFGLLRSDFEQEFSKALMAPAERLSAQMLAEALAGLRATAAASLDADGFGRAEVEFIRSADLRYLGQAYELNVPLRTGPCSSTVHPDDIGNLVEGFHREHERTYGHRSQNDPVQIVNLRLAVRVRMASYIAGFARRPPSSPTQRQVIFESGPVLTPVIARDALDATPRRGPFVIEDYDTTCVVPPGIFVLRDPEGNIEIRNTGE